jgi:hypothetical protein
MPAKLEDILKALEPYPELRLCMLFVAKRRGAAWGTIGEKATKIIAEMGKLLDQLPKS